MNINGLNKLGLSQAAPQTATNSKSSKSSTGTASSFGEILGQAKESEKQPVQKDEGQSRRFEFANKSKAQDKSQPQERAQTQEKPQAQTQDKSQAKNQSQQEAGAQTKGQTSQEKPQASKKANVPVQDLEMLMVPGQPGIPGTLTGATPIDPAINPALNMNLAPAAKSAAANFGDESVDSLTRRAVWNDFLRKMKDELGVSAEDVLGAFSSLSAEDLAKPPEQSVDKVVMALGLNDQQAQIARQYFSDLVNKTNSKSMGDEISASEKQISLTLMSQREVQRKQLDKTLERMNQNFFNKAPAAAPVVATQDMKSQALPEKGESQKSQDYSLATALPAAPLSRDPATAADLKARALEASQPKIDVSSMQKTTEDKVQGVDQLIAKFMESQAPMMKPAQDLAAPTAQAINAQAFGAANASATQAAPAAESASMIKALQNLIDGDARGGESEEDGEYTTDGSFLGHVGQDGLNKSNAPGQEFKLQMAQAAPKEMSVPDVVNQAQVMVRDGGGEMKVTLNQEGLGEVAMKVSVDHGKVNVQMITESDEAKKMIERSLGDLKSQLSQNNLQLDTIKVDTATNLGKQLEQQYQDAQRQQTQAFMQQFRQDNQGWRQSFFEPPAQRFYKNQSETTRDVTAPTEPGASRRAAARRLDLVA